MRDRAAVRPALPAGHAGFGSTFVDAPGDPAEGIAALQEAAKLVHLTTEISLGLAKLHRARGDLAEARQFLERILRWSHEAADKVEEARTLLAELAIEELGLETALPTFEEDSTH
jgi:tetratricopeptide (TPR) repeat protein